MATASPTTLTTDLTAAVSKALLDPDKVMARLAFYDEAEAKGRPAEYKMSILAYALAGYITASIEVPARYNLRVTPLDTSVVIAGENKNPKRAAKDRFEQEIAYPLWLASFFEDDIDRFTLLEPDSTVKLEEILDELHQHVVTLSTTEDEEEDETETEEDEDSRDEEDDDGDEADEEPAEVDSAEAAQDDELDDGEDEDEDEDEDDLPVDYDPRFANKL